MLSFGSNAALHSCFSHLCIAAGQRPSDPSAQLSPSPTQLIQATPAALYIILSE